MSRFERLLEPAKIGVMELRSRIVMPPMGTNLNAVDGSVTDYYINYHAERAKGGVGLQIMGVVAIDMEIISKFTLTRLLAERGVGWLTNTKILEVTDKGVVTVDKNLRRQTIKAETVVLAMGFKSNKGLYKALEGKVTELYAIGDSVEPRKIIHAIHEGAFIARQI